MKAPKIFSLIIVITASTSLAFSQEMTIKTIEKERAVGQSISEAKARHAQSIADIRIKQEINDLNKLKRNDPKAERKLERAEQAIIELEKQNDLYFQLPQEDQHGTVVTDSNKRNYYLQVTEGSFEVSVMYLNRRTNKGYGWSMSGGTITFIDTVKNKTIVLDPYGGSSQPVPTTLEWRWALVHLKKSLLIAYQNANTTEDRTQIRNAYEHVNSFAVYGTRRR